MVYNLFGINWVILGSVREELWASEGLCKKKKFVKLILLTIFWVIQKERNSRALDGIEGEWAKIRDRWFHLFSSLILGHDIYMMDDFKNVIEMITTL